MVATLAVVAALSLLAVLVARVLRNDQEFVLVREARLESLAWAQAGMSIASHPGIDRGDPALEWRSEGGDGGYSVMISSEDAKLNINAVLQRGDTALLNDLFELWGMDVDDADALIGAMQDWIDEDDAAELNGAEEEAYEGLGLPGLPPNRPFRSVREMGHVLGAENLDLLRPGWDTLFSVRASGKIDLYDAPAELIAAACAVPIDIADDFIEQRWGEDGIPDTGDEPFQSVQEALLLLGGLGIPEEMATDRLTVRSGLQRITSTGHVGRIRRTVAAVVNKGQGKTQLLWRGELSGREAKSAPVEDF